MRIKYCLPGHGGGEYTDIILFLVMVVENIRIRYSSGNGGGEYKDKV